jgi:hypothetical protein
MVVVFGKPESVINCRPVRSSACDKNNQLVFVQPRRKSCMLEKVKWYMGCTEVATVVVKIESSATDEARRRRQDGSGWETLVTQLL